MEAEIEADEDPKHSAISWRKKRTERIRKPERGQYSGEQGEQGDQGSKRIRRARGGGGLKRAEVISLFVPIGSLASLHSLYFSHTFLHTHPLHYTVALDR